MKTIFQIIRGWLPLAIATAGLCGLAYLTVQQSLRMGANDPQIQMAEDAASALNGGASVDSIIPATKVELATSLAPFMIVFDDSGKVLASSATLHGSVPVLPIRRTGLYPSKRRRPRHLATRERRSNGNGGGAI